MTDVMIQPAAFKALLYDILTTAVDDKAPELAMQQQMGIQLSSAVLKDKGILNIQFQSIAIKNVMVSVTEALKMIDGAKPVAAIEAEDCTSTVKVIESGNDLEIIIEDNLASMTSLDDFLGQMTYRYLEMALKKFPTIKEAYQALGVSYARLLKLRKKHEL